jgi:hypothetical protein
MRHGLLAALVSCADSSHKVDARRFVQGLSSDELQFIAGFLGACIVDSPEPCTCRAQWAERIGRYQKAGNADLDHKMILLLEFLCRTASPAASLPSAI